MKSGNRRNAKTSDDLCGCEARRRRERRAEVTPDPLGPLGTTPRPPEGTTIRSPKGTTGRGCGGSTGTPPEGTTGRGRGGNTGRPQGGSTQINDFQAPIQWPRHVCCGGVAWGKERETRKRTRRLANEVYTITREMPGCSIAQMPDYL